jgi:hypothetical protein
MISPREAKPSGHFLADAAYRAFFGEAQTTRPVEITRASQRYAIAWDKSDLEAGSFPLGQTLIVTAGAGWVQEWDKPMRSIKPGDTVWIPPGVKHWHGATASTGMSHIAIAEVKNGQVVDWMEQVSEEQYDSAR